MDVKRTEGEPHDRLTQLCKMMTDVLDFHIEPNEDIKCMVFLQDKDQAGLTLHGYENDIEAVADLFLHMKSIFNANGKELYLYFAPIKGEG